METKKWYGLDASGILVYFETQEEAARYYKNYPKETYQIGENPKPIGQ